MYTIECNVTRKRARLLAFKVKITEARTNYSASFLLNRHATSYIRIYADVDASRMRGRR